MNQGTIYHSGNMTSFFLLSYVRKAPGEHVHILHIQTQAFSLNYKHIHTAHHTPNQIPHCCMFIENDKNNMFCIRWGFMCGEYSLNTLSLYVCYRMWMDFFCCCWVKRCMGALESIVCVLLRICIVTFTYLPCTSVLWGILEVVFTV